jgi:hypothetical protein
MSFVTIQEKMDRAVGQTTGFDYLRIGLSLAVLTWHSIWFAGQAQLSDSLWDGKFRFLGSGIVPVFLSREACFGRASRSSSHFVSSGFCLRSRWRLLFPQRLSGLSLPTCRSHSI